MKKILLIAAAAILATAANAQLMTSRTFFGKESNTTWFVRAGMSINNVTNLERLDSGIGYDFNFGFQKPIASSAVYWGMDLGIGTRGFSGKIGPNGEDATSTSHGVRWSPITFGYKYSITDAIKIDGHLGAYVSYDFAHSADGENLRIETGRRTESYEHEKPDVGMQVGVGVWFKRVNLDFTYQRGFIGMYDLPDEYKTPCSSNFMIRLGFAF